MRKKNNRYFVRDEAMDEIRKTPEYKDTLRNSHERNRSYNHKSMIVSAPTRIGKTSQPFWNKLVKGETK